MSDDDDGKYEGPEMTEEELQLIKMALDLVVKNRARRKENNVFNIEDYREKDDEEN